MQSVTGALFERITKSVGMSMYRAENTFEIKMKKKVTQTIHIESNNVMLHA